MCQRLDAVFVVEVVSITTDNWLGPLSGVTEYITEKTFLAYIAFIILSKQFVIPCWPVFKPQIWGTGLPKIIRIVKIISSTMVYISRS